MTEPVFVLRDQYASESYWPEDYVAGAIPVLHQLGWVTRPVRPDDRTAAERVLTGLFNLDLDETDVFPFGLLWALRSTGAVGEVHGLDAQLTAWREWEETDHVGHSLEFLPWLPDTYDCCGGRRHTDGCPTGRDPRADTDEETP